MVGALWLSYTYIVSHIVLYTVPCTGHGVWGITTKLVLYYYSYWYCILVKFNNQFTCWPLECWSHSCSSAMKSIHPRCSLESCSLAGTFEDSKGHAKPRLFSNHSQHVYSLLSQYNICIPWSWLEPMKTSSLHLEQVAYGYQQVHDRWDQLYCFW